MFSLCARCSYVGLCWIYSFSASQPWLYWTKCTTIYSFGDLFCVNIFTHVHFLFVCFLGCCVLCSAQCASVSVCDSCALVSLMPPGVGLPHTNWQQRVAGPSCRGCRRAACPWLHIAARVIKRGRCSALWPPATFKDAPEQVYGVQISKKEVSTPTPTSDTFLSWSHTD